MVERAFTPSASSIWRPGDEPALDDQRGVVLGEVDQGLGQRDGVGAGVGHSRRVVELAAPAAPSGVPFAARRASVFLTTR